MGQFRGCLKYILFIFNFALFVLGCAVVGVGIWLKVDEGAKHHVKSFTELNDEKYQISYNTYKGDSNDLTVKMAYALIVLGILTIMVVALGLLGAHKESPTLLSVNAICLLVLLVGLLVVGVWAHKERLRGYDYLEEDGFQQDVYTPIHTAINQYNDPDMEQRKAARDFMERIQKKFKCCGGRGGPSDWKTITHIENVCKIEAHRNKGCEDDYLKYVKKEIEDFLDHRFEMIAGIALGVAVCLGLGLVFTILLCFILKRTTVITVN